MGGSAPSAAAIRNDEPQPPAKPLVQGLSAPRAPIEITDDAGRTITLAAPARRIVTLAPHLAELVAAAGGVDQLVGVSRYSDFPNTVRGLPQISDAFAVNLEALAELKPDLVLAWRSGMNRRQLDRIESLGFTVFESEIDSIDDVASTLQRLGRLMGTSRIADAQAGQQRARWQSLAARYAHRSSVRVFYQVSSQPLMTVNGQHLVSRTMAACGGVNAFSGLPTLVATVSWEAAARADPQLIVLADTGDRASQLGQWPRLGEVAAVRAQRYAWIPADLLSRMGPRFVDGAALLCEAIDAARRAARP